MGAAALPIAGLVASGVGGLISSNAQNHAANAAQGAADAATAGQNALIQKGVLPIDQELLKNYQNNYAPLESQIGNYAGNIAGTLDSRNTQNDYGSVLNALFRPAVADNTTGYNVQGLNSGAINLLTDPRTDMAGIQNQGGKALNYYNNEAQRGLDPAYVNAAIGNSNQSFLSGINSIRNSLGSNMTNPTGAIDDLSVQHQSGLIQLLSQLGAQNQEVKDRAMGAALQTAGGIDADRLNRVTSAATLGTNAENRDLANMQAGLATSQDLFKNLIDTTTSARSTLPGVANSFSGLASSYGNAASGAATQLGNIRSTQTNPFANFLSNFAGTAAQQGWFNGGGNSPMQIAGGGAMAPAY